MSLRYAAWLTYTSLAIGLLKLFVPGWGVFNLSTIPSDQKVRAVMSVLSVFALLLALLFLIKQGKTWAKYILIALFAIGVIALVNVSTEFAVSFTAGALVVIQAIVQAAAIVFLLKSKPENTKI